MVLKKDGFLRLVGTLAVFALMIHTIVDVSIRFLAESALQSTLEYVKYWHMPIISSVGVVAAYKDLSHISVPLFYTRVNQIGRDVMDAAQLLFSLLFFAPLAYFSFILALEKMRQGEYHATTLAWPGRFLIPAMAIYGVFHSIRAVAPRVQKARSSHARRGAAVRHLG